MHICIYPNRLLGPNPRPLRDTLELRPQLRLPLRAALLDAPHGLRVVLPQAVHGLQPLRRGVGCGRRRPRRFRPGLERLVAGGRRGDLPMTSYAEAFSGPSELP